MPVVHWLLVKQLYRAQMPGYFNWWGGGLAYIDFVIFTTETADSIGVWAMVYATKSHFQSRTLPDYVHALLTLYKKATWSILYQRYNTHGPEGHRPCYNNFDPFCLIWLNSDWFTFQSTPLISLLITHVHIVGTIAPQRIESIPPFSHFP